MRPEWFPSGWKGCKRLKDETAFTCRNCGEQAVWFLEKQPGAMSYEYESTFICDSFACREWFLERYE